MLREYRPYTNTCAILLEWFVSRSFNGFLGERWIDVVVMVWKMTQGFLVASVAKLIRYNMYIYSVSISVKMDPSSWENIGEIWRFHSGDYKDYCLLWYETVLSGRSWLTFLRNASKHVPDYMASYLRRQQSSYIRMFENGVSVEHLILIEWSNRTLEVSTARTIKFSAVRRI
jgi:hypothetical protein